MSGTRSAGAIERVRVALYAALGETISRALKDRTVEEIRANEDGTVWVVYQGEGKKDSGAKIAPAQAETVIRILADAAGVIVTADQPLVQGSLPLSGERFQGVFPPVSKAPFFVIRKPAATAYSLDDYVKMGSATERQVQIIRELIGRPNPANILVVGGTFTGKTTFGNAMLAEPAFTQDRCAIIEDTRELNFAGRDSVSLLAKPTEPAVGMADLLKVALRVSPQRIIVGEVRDVAAWSMIQAWNTGHDGGFGTLHANSPADALIKLEDLVGGVMARVPHASIAAAVQAIVHIEFVGTTRRVGQILRVKGWSADRGYHLEVLI